MLLRIFVFGVLLATSGFAQQTAGTLTGSVTDATGAVIPAATIKAVNLATNAARETLTDASGNYTIPFFASW